MKLREIMKWIEGDGEITDEIAVQCFFVMSAILRTWDQGEASTFEGECAAVNAIAEHYPGYQPTPEGWKRFSEECGEVMDLDVPDRVLKMIVSTHADGGE